jgi:hypothetical protein
MSGGICQLYGMRGGGKTNVSIALSIAVSTGSALFSDMFAPRPYRVLYVDGEMVPSQVVTRYRKFYAGLGQRCSANLCYMSHAAFPDGIPTLYDPSSGGRQMIERAAARHRADLIILDNISSLVRGGEENSNDAWEPVNDWLLGLRRLNYTTLLIHHAGKRALDGSIRQRGGSKKEDAMDCVVQIDETAKPKDGKIPLRWTYEKCRTFTPASSHFDFSLVFDDAAGKAWIEEGHYAKIENQPPPYWLEEAIKLKAQGMSLRFIAKTYDVSHTTVQNYLSMAKKTTLSSMS